LLGEHIGNKTVIPVLTKVDAVKNREADKLEETVKSEFRFGHRLVKISVNKSIGVTGLVSELDKFLPEGTPLYPDDDITDRDMRFLCAELIREKIFRFTHKEIPYSTAVQIIKYVEEVNIHKIYAEIYVERESQKGIIVGKKGELIKKIGSNARADIEQLAGTKVYLELFVKLRKDWTTDNTALKEFGYK
jgi:GTP-binding protein Era